MPLTSASNDKTARAPRPPWPATGNWVNNRTRSAIQGPVPQDLCAHIDRGFEVDKGRTDRASVSCLAHWMKQGPALLWGVAAAIVGRDRGWRAVCDNVGSVDRQQQRGCPPMLHIFRSASAESRHTSGSIQP